MPFSAIIRYCMLSAVLISACTSADQPALPKTEPAFTNKIQVKEKTITLSQADVDILKASKVFKLFYYKNKQDSGFAYTTFPGACYTVSSNTFTGQDKRKVVTAFESASDLFSYKNALFVYNMKTKIIKPFMINTETDSSELYQLSLKGEYNPRLPYSAQLIGLNKKLCFIYNYSSKNSSNPNYVDSSLFIIVIDSNSYYKIGRYPPVFFKEDLRFDDTYFTVDSADNIFYVHAGFDSVYKINIKGEELSRGILHQYPKRDKYKPHKQGDLAYIRKYEATNDKNQNIFLLKNKYVIVIKQLAAKQVLDKPAYKIFIFNTSLEKLYTTELHEDIVPGAIPNSNGFLLFKKDLTKVFCYELP